MAFKLLKIGVTGNIGCGKSEVCRLLKKAGIPIISADLVARKLMNTDNQIKLTLKQIFGENIYHSNGKLNRKKVAEIIFTDKSAKEKINKIVHPRVIQYEHQLLLKLYKTGHFPIAGVEAALIYEAKSEHFFDFIIVVSASEQTVIKRLKKRDGFSENQIKNRIQSQMSLKEKIKRADYIINNDGTLQDLKTEVEKLIYKLQTLI